MLTELAVPVALATAPVEALRIEKGRAMLEASTLMVEGVRCTALPRERDADVPARHLVCRPDAQPHIDSAPSVNGQFAAAGRPRAGRVEVEEGLLPQAPKLLQGGHVPVGVQRHLAPRRRVGADGLVIVDAALDLLAAIGEVVLQHEGVLIEGLLGLEVVLQLARPEGRGEVVADGRHGPQAEELQGGALPSLDDQREPPCGLVGDADIEDHARAGGQTRAREVCAREHGLAVEVQLGEHTRGPSVDDDGEVLHRMVQLADKILQVDVFRVEGWIEGHLQLLVRRQQAEDFEDIQARDLLGSRDRLRQGAGQHRERHQEEELQTRSCRLCTLASLGRHPSKPFGTASTKTDKGQRHRGRWSQVGAMWALIARAIA
mmetsp:Transcript_48333/g.155807  ORF Transcript_48333/g.155807 Transcript_48333/m.155807 type:complete len:375 (-) Transcript_48333:14-1138(-)